jgi:hypothetical protein
MMDDYNEIDEDLNFSKCCSIKCVESLNVCQKCLVELLNLIDK